MTEKVNPAMILLARESRGMSQPALAEATGLSQPKLSRIQNGQLNVSDADLDKIATALRYPLSFFRQGGPSMTAGATCVYHRKLQSLGVGESKRVHATLDIIRMQIGAMYRSVPLEPRKHPIPRLDIDAFDGKADHIAGLVRSHWRLPGGPISNVTAMLEDAGVIVVRARLGTDKIDAMSQVSDELPPVIFVNADKPTDRMRYTLCHELGHLVMHTEAFEDIETQANLFASELLMPAREFRAELVPPINLQKLAALKPRWKVSIAAMLYRARQLGVVTERHQRTLYTHINHMGWRREEPIPLPIEEPKIVPQIVEFHTKELRYSIENLAGMLHTTPDEFRATFFPRAGHLRITK